MKRRRLKAVLRQERELAEMTQKDVAAALDWHVSKILRIEQGAVGITPTDLRALLGLYKMTDERRETELVELARASRNLGWSEYRDVYSQPSLTLFGMEGAARTIYKHEPTFVPGLLQTEEYARALLVGLGHSEDETERMVSARLERQEILEREVKPKLEFILGEAALSAAVGGRGVMRRQLDRLKELDGQDGVSLQVLPFKAGAHPRMGEAFTILEFFDESLDDLLYLENAGSESTSREDPELIAKYLRDFLTLQSLADEHGSFPAAVDGIAGTRLSSSQNGSLAKEGEAPARS